MHGLYRIDNIRKKLLKFYWVFIMYLESPVVLSFTISFSPIFPIFSPFTPAMITLCIELNKGEFLDTKVVRLEKGWAVQFVRGHGLFGQAVLLRISGAADPVEFNFTGTASVRDLDSRICQTFPCDNFGVFKYEFFDLESDEENDISAGTTDSPPSGRGFFCIVPEWDIARGRKKLTLDSLSLITHLSKLLGPLREWEERLAVARESGFNVIHLTPVQRLGISNSSYSIAEFDQLNPSLEADFEELKQFVDRMEHGCHMLTIQDVVWNHAAKNARWLQVHPECAFNCANSPHLRPAYLLDRALYQFSREIGHGKWTQNGVPAVIDSEAHLGALRHLLATVLFPSIRLHEFFQLDEEKMKEQFRKAVKNGMSGDGQVQNSKGEALQIQQDTEFRRFGCSVDMELAAQIFGGPNPDLEDSVVRFGEHLRHLNERARETVEGHVGAAIEAVMGHVAYERVAGEGPRRGQVNEQWPLVTSYFLHPAEFGTDNGWEADEQLAYEPTKAARLMAFNGWMMLWNADPLVNFAEWPSQAYLRREIVCWGDSVKLNYGAGPAHCPFLWDYMCRYTEQCARMFHGFRIDNCHGTPINVAEYLLEKARKVRRDLYVVAELFTGSEQSDNLFVNRLGITSLIREAQNAPDSHEQGRFVYRYGGDPVGAFHRKVTRPAPWAVAHALLYDQTHDNPSPIQKRTAYDVVPTAAMCAIGNNASGTVRGYDEFVARHIDVVTERRLYRKWTELGHGERGAIRARRLLNDLHVQLSETGFTEIFVDQVNEDIVAVTRHNPSSHESVLLIAHTCFTAFKWTPNCRPVQVADQIDAILFELKTVEEPEKEGNPEEESGKEEAEEKAEEGSEANGGEVIRGLANFRVECYQNVPLDASDAIQIRDGAIHFKLFTSGSVVALKIVPKKETREACEQIERTIGAQNARDDAIALLRALSLHDFNFLLFRCEPEERCVTGGGGAYEVPAWGKLVYCGLAGIRTLLRRIQESNDLGHPFCENIRQGIWLIEYFLARLRFRPSLAPLATLLQNAFAPLRSVPHFLRPAYFELLFSYFYSAIEQVLLDKLGCWSLLPRIHLTELLAISSVAFLAEIPSAKLPPISVEQGEEKLSLSAGLPHFAEGIWRNWGRDTFIALPGLLLLTGRHPTARSLILAFAGTLRHGLIPNLLAEGKAPRYNCRDAVWFWMVAIIRYCEMVENGEQILQDTVIRLYPTDEAEYGESEQLEPLHATMYEALCRHFEGIEFRERNAGAGIDEHMRDEGFNVRAYICRKSGLIRGGNRWNCGTWMDKMGSSERAGNRGEPATPRDGAAVELQGLALRVAQGLCRLSRFGKFPYQGLKGRTDKEISCTWAQWATNIRGAFEAQFFVDENCEDKFVNRRNIIKDSVGSSLGYTDFQLRPNFCISLDAAPSIIAPQKAWVALQVAGKVLAANAPLGICTLDPEDWAYNGVYDNGDDGTNKSSARGWNYHQGPEWLWVAGCYMSAKLKVAALLREKAGDPAPWRSAVGEVRERLFRMEQCVRNSQWASLPELTNARGAACPHSCPAQAWSVGCVMETVETMNRLMMREEDEEGMKMEKEKEDEQLGEMQKQPATAEVDRYY